MNAVILCNRLTTLRSLLPVASEPLRFLILEESPAGLEVRTFLQRRGNAGEVPLASMNRARSIRIRAAYVEALGRLNAEQASLRWWAMPFTTKNPIATDLCRDTFAFLLIANLVTQHGGLMVVVTQSAGLADQVTSWGSTRNIVVQNAVRPAWSAIRWINARLPLLALSARVLRALWFKTVLRASKFLPEAGTKLDLLMVTLVHPSSVPVPGQFNDTYFGGLSRWLTERRATLRVAGIVDRLSVGLARVFCMSAEGQDPMPFDALPRVRDILRCAWNAYGSYRESKSCDYSAEIEGVRIDVLLRAAVQEAHTSGNVFFNFCVYHASSYLAATLRIAAGLYPYENKAWEKMFLLGIRAVSPQTRLIGYQHASVTPSHTNFMLTEKEKGVMPLPDAIVTMGAVTRDWLVREGQHLPERLIVGCALRQARSGAVTFRKRRGTQPSRILVALATNLEEYVRVLLFLHEAATSDHWEIALRPHPTIRLSEAVKLLPDGRLGFPHTISAVSLADGLAWADVALYASSTVGLEAVGAGIPSVYLDLGDILSTDPMDGWADFKWIARKPGDLKKVLDEIAILSDEQYELRQRAGYDYVNAYLYPMTDSNLQAFLQPC